jgi:hypothetical protein
MIAAFLLGLIAAGCESEPSNQRPVYPVRGRVLFAGRPLANALLVFQPVGLENGDSGPRPTGRTDVDGVFELHTYVGDDGAPEGNYLVAISLAPASRETNVFAKIDPATAKRGADPIGLRYAYPEKSGLKASVTAGKNALEPFELK